jgi:TonB family protein
MFRVLLETGPRSREPRTHWTAASVLAHATLITLAVAATTSGSAHSTREREGAHDVYYVAPRELSGLRAPAGQRASQAGGVQELSALPRIPVPALPGFDALLPQRQDPLIGSDPWRAEGGFGVRDSGGVPAGGVYTDRLVERPVVPRADNASPAYPASLRAAGLEGDVLVRFVVDTSGRVELSSIGIVQATHPLFAEAVRRWLTRTRYTPAEVAGRPVRQLVEQRVGFTLRR